MFDQPRCTVKFFAKIHVAAGPIPLAPGKWAKRQDPGEYGDRARRLYFARSERSDRAPARASLRALSPYSPGSCRFAHFTGARGIGPAATWIFAKNLTVHRGWSNICLVEQMFE